MNVLALLEGPQLSGLTHTGLFCAPSELVEVDISSNIWPYKMYRCHIGNLCLGKDDAIVEPLWLH